MGGGTFHFGDRQEDTGVVAVALDNLGYVVHHEAVGLALDLLFIAILLGVVCVIVGHGGVIVFILIDQWLIGSHDGKE